MAVPHIGTEAEVAVTEEVVDPVQGNIRAEWEWIKPLIEKILAKTPQLTFRPEDVYAACVSGEAILWIAEEGFVVTTVEYDEYNGERTFLLWLAGAREIGMNAVRKHQAFFENIAREAGMAKLELRSAVTDLKMYFEGGGWELDTAVYTRRL